jgi:hypothetical protein
MERLGPALVGAVGVAIVLVTVLDWRSACARSAAAERAHVQRVADANRIIELRAREQTALDKQRPESDVLRLVTTALRAAGLDRTRPQIAPGGSTAVLGESSQTARLMRQTVTVTLADVSTPQIGAFLAAFEADSGPWGVADLALSTSARPDAQAPLYTARLTLAAVYVADHPS